MITEIVEVLERSEQGVTRPFICRGNNNKLYFVKGHGAGKRSLLCEWIAGNLGVSLGLPIAPFETVLIPEALISSIPEGKWRDLGTGPAFGSIHQQAMELTAQSMTEVPDHVQQDIFVFDWWIRNEDRTLSQYGGNPNLTLEIGVQRTYHY
ncbi:hypothetical protein Mmc1_1069 [Magnetococcus marinus MC-1]|uniref:HipA-like kinase domain-containing protein n=1 Tax=Magnetococcus marinus (strain ATCC BAA-1437 / JCM 17883 / MC-1) TaxID=156889 RepID=A0L6J4_MAGMM|nr:HipA family kinase [Magnetococcus marinus]ABK43587.1 hypothetical protein Mmc1_1069 [Magnetococcus marinus MC-1]